jgi:hypothetical protein
MQYMPVFKPFLIAGLQAHDEQQVCSAAIGVTADLCRALENEVTPHLDEIMQLFVQILQVSVLTVTRLRYLLCLGPESRQNGKTGRVIMLR